MSAQQFQQQAEIATAVTAPPSEDSIGNVSSQWSASTRSIVKDGSCSPVDDDTTTAQSGCFPILQLLKSSFLWKKTLVPVDNKKLLTDLKEQTELIVDFFDGCLTPKLKLYAEQVQFPGTPQSFGDIGTNGKYCLPTAQVWTATYFLKLCALSKTSTSNEFINSNALRRSFILLFWEMESAKSTVQEFHTGIVKFANELNSAFKRLGTVLLTSSKRIKLHPSSQLQLATIKDFDFTNIKRNLELKTKRDNKIPLVLELNPSLRSTFKFSLSIDTTKNIDGCVITRNQDCSKVSSEVQEEIISGLLKFAVEAIKNCQCLLDSSKKRISCRGIIKKGTGDDSKSNKDVTCYSTINCVKALVAQLLSSRNAHKLGETEQNELYGSIALLFEKWNEYLCCSQWVISKFYELCDMISICYQFTLKYIKMNIPELEVVQKEVNVKSKFQKTNMKSRSQINNLKNYAIGSLIEECNAKGIINVSSTGEMKGQAIYNNFNQQSLESTMYHLVIQDCPLELAGNCGWSYRIVLRPTPDLERVDPDMILIDDDYTIGLVKADEYHNLCSNNTKESNTLTLNTFKTKLVTRTKE